MAENMMNSNHKASNEQSRQGYEKTFCTRCRYHSTRPATFELDGHGYCDACWAKVVGSDSDE